MNVVIPSMYNGPPDSANGGYACGLFSRLAIPADGRPPAVVLHAPPPLATKLDVRPDVRRTYVWNDDRLVATVSSGSLNLPVVEPVTMDAARRAESAFEGSAGHPFPTCFVCGNDRVLTGGFPLTPGRVAGHDLVACIWTPDGGEAGEVPIELIWSALDCPGGWASDPVREPMVLSRMSLMIHTRPKPGCAHVVVGRLWRRYARTANVGTALYSGAGELVATAAATWVTLEQDKP